MTPFLKYCFELAAVGLWWRDVLTHKHDCRIDWGHFTNQRPCVLVKMAKKNDWERREGLFEKLTSEYLALK